ncbi:MAG: winged helix-turn-helix domain-containing protein [Candidatus Bathyarchaeota archaeon]|nr:winged helix-turn-helix domain-containing protein [Candidatus Bathyarchaeota archaeon]
MEITKLTTPLQTALINYGGETKLVKLKNRNGWSIAKGFRRGKFEIMAEILLFCDQQRAKTCIMYKVNLNYAQLKQNLAFLTLQGLLLRKKDKYVTTEKGYRFLSLFVQLTDMLNC